MVLGLLPAVFVSISRISYLGVIGELKSKLLSMLLLVVCIVVIVAAFSQFYASFFREYKSVRLYINPIASFYAGSKYFFHSTDVEEIDVAPLGLDARKSLSSDRDLIVLVIGETARADHFSLNGYERETNPLLKQENVINFTDVHSCGTTTAISVPCMFSSLDREDYSDSTAKSTENILDVLQHAGVNVLWRDNNSDSKSVALRVTYQDYKSPEINTICDDECRDVGMLVGLDDYIDSHPTGDILIVLHQMGSHGPAYYKRYPAAFEKFKPTCKSNQIETCSMEEIVNSYDNSILYTDYFLSKVIQMLKTHTDKFKTAMMYVSDHGESLAEKGLYLHGMPYFIAPQAQTHVPGIIWLSNNYDVDIQRLRIVSGNAYSHDNMFHTLLGMMNIKTSIYDRQLDILTDGTKSESH
jgi:lipid A ethanolaminephosphotransferase